MNVILSTLPLVKPTTQCNRRFRISIDVLNPVIRQINDRNLTVTSQCASLRSYSYISTTTISQMTNGGRKLDELIKNLTIPRDILRFEAIQQSPLLLDLIEQWKESLASTLAECLAILRAEETALTMDRKTNVLFVLLPFIPSELWLRSCRDGPSIPLDEWSTAGSLSMARELMSLSIISSPSSELVNLVLTDKLRPVFRSSPHPNLSSLTGRRLARPAGGSMAMQDYYDDQLWKDHPGVANVVLWCVNALESEAFEHMWHLVIPPVMTLLDDFEAMYKLQGVIIVQEMLRQLPKGLIQRTGVDGLIQRSLRNSLSHLQSSETPDLITTAIRASVDLTLQITSPATGARPTSDQFDQLSSLLGEGIISGIWLYAEDKPTVMYATFEALPYLLRALGKGSIRFLQVLIPQITHTLIPRPSVPPQRRTQVAALDVLATLLDVCAPRIGPWKETVLNGIGRCWVEIIDDEIKEENGQSQDVENTEGRDSVKKALQGFCVKLAQGCPSVIKEEYPRFLKADRTLFEDLLSGVPKSIAQDP